jgi:hypothetical protein
MTPLVLHEIVRPGTGQEEAYMTSVIANRTRPGERQEFQRPIGNFRTVETAGAWSRVINLWEFFGADGYVRNNMRQFQDQGRDELHEDWWNRNINLRHGGFDRVCVPTPFSPDLNRLREQGIRGRVFLNQILQLPFDEPEAYFERLGAEFLPAAGRYGWHLFGAYSVLWCPREVVTLWAFPEWANLSSLLAERRSDPDLRRWFDYHDRLVAGSVEFLLLPARVNPLGISG